MFVLFQMGPSQDCVSAFTMYWWTVDSCACAIIGSYFPIFTSLSGDALVMRWSLADISVVLNIASGFLAMPSLSCYAFGLKDWNIWHCMAGVFIPNNLYVFERKCYLKYIDFCVYLFIFVYFLFVFYNFPITE